MKQSLIDKNINQNIKEKQNSQTIANNKTTLKKGKQQKCFNCGGNLIYYPNKQDLMCEKCLVHQKIAHISKVQTHTLTTVDCNTQPKNVINYNSSMQCPNCGSKISLNKFEYSKDCDYCNSSVVAQDASLVVKKPDGIIPFMFDKDLASDKFVQNVKKNFWAPNKFKKKLPKSNIEGDYIPSFGFNADVVYTYNGKLYNNVTVRDSDGNSRTERRYFNISGANNTRYENILVESSSKMMQNQINGVLPFNYNQSKKYSDAYIAGYVVEHYDTAVGGCLQKYKTLLEENIKKDILSKYSYDGVSFLNIHKNVSNESYSYYLVPVYKFTYSYKNKTYKTYMNGQTGRLDNNIPKSKLKTTLVVLLPFLLVISFIILGFIFGK